MRSDWVEALFARLSVRYGAEFSRRYEGLEQQAVIADWSEVLDGYSGETVRAALAHLPADRAPNAAQFAEICRIHAVGAEVPALPAPEPSPEAIRRASEALSKVAQGVGSQTSEFGLDGLKNKNPRAYAIKRLEQRIALGGATRFQREALETMKRASGGGDLPAAGGRQIKADELPPGMRPTV